MAGGGKTRKTNNRIVERKRAGAIGRTILFLVVLGALVWLASSVLERKASMEKYQIFFRKRDDFDVLFFGTSHVVDDIYPMELWEDYGITSYNCGGDGNRVPTSYWTMMNCLDYASPEVAVIDGYWLSQEIKTSNQYSETHLSFDAFPLSKNKVRAVYDLLDDPAYDEQGFTVTEERKPIGLLWDFSVYHARWTELTKDDLFPQISPELGASTKVGYTPAGEITPLPREDQFEGDSVGIAYLKKMIEECQSRGIQVVLTYLPFPAGEDCWREANRLYEIASAYGVPYINFLAMDVVNYTTDTYDTNSHLNPSGAKKVTDYLGNFLSDTMGVPDHRGEADYGDWNNLYEKYDAYKLQLLKTYTQFEYTAQLLCDRHYNVSIEVYDPLVLQDARVKENLDNLEKSGNLTLQVPDGKNREENAVEAAESVAKEKNKADGKYAADTGYSLRVTASHAGQKDVIYDALYRFETDENGSLSNTRTEVIDNSNGPVK